MICERCHHEILTVAGYGRNVNTDKVYCAVCVYQMSQAPPTNADLAAFLACKREYGKPKKEEKN